MLQNAGLGKLVWDLLSLATGSQFFGVVVRVRCLRVGCTVSGYLCVCVCVALREGEREDRL